MTISAEKLKVVRVQRDCRIVYVVWRQVYLVVNDDAGLVDPASKTAFA
jgi:hypothetical protein